MDRVHQLPRINIHKLLRQAGIYTLVIIGALFIGFPFFQMIMTSFKDISEVYRNPMVIFPSEWRWQNYVDAFTLVPMGRFAINSVIYTVTITVGELLMGITAGYAFARLRFPFREKLFFIILITFMIPGQITLIPRFIMLADLRWMDTYQGLIIPQISSAFGLFLLRQNFKSLPQEIFDAATIDGAGHLRKMFSVALPMSKPILWTVTLLAAISHWNDYQWPLIVTNTPEMRTLPLGIQLLRSVMDLVHWNLVMAGATIVVIPILILFILAQKQFIEGAISGALKG
jgi:multiple sugar transport system permease protein/sn-glycerol 3-phosphate transport system permease protein